jgi:predicted PurR-regulated permease PerM
MAVSSRLSINTLVTIVIILLGGLLWGAAGMILFIPYTAILKLIADRTDRLRTLSIILGSGKPE